MCDVSGYAVTFIADYFVLTTHIDKDCDVELSNEIIAHKATKLIREMYDFDPLDFAYEVEIKEL